MAKAIRYQTLERKLRKLGCTSRAGKGDHVVWYCPCGKHTAVAVYSRLVSPGVVRGVIAKLARLPEGWLR